MNTPRQTTLDAHVVPRCARDDVEPVVGGRIAAAIATLSIAALVGCSHVPAPSARPPVGTDPQALRERIRDYAKQHCGRCHIASLPSARPAALAIFNLDADAWSSTLTVAQLEGGFPRRLNARLDEAGRAELRAFLDHEIALRKR
jgi:hypothetical protein